MFIAFLCGMTKLATHIIFCSYMELEHPYLNAPLMLPTCVGRFEIHACDIRK